MQIPVLSLSQPSQRREYRGSTLNYPRSRQENRGTICPQLYRGQGTERPLNSIVVVIEVNVSWPKPIAPDEFLISRRPLILGITRQHTLYAHADALDALNWAPSLLAEQVETNDAVGVDMGMHRDRSVGKLNEGYLRWFCGRQHCAFGT
jgi:hypothetical protein